jgi:hypothetical protein
MFCILNVVHSTIFRRNPKTIDVLLSTVINWSFLTPEYVGLYVKYLFNFNTVKRSLTTAILLIMCLFEMINSVKTKTNPNLI